MNIMNRDFIVKASKDYHINKKIDNAVIRKILIDYCCNIHNKDKINTERLIDLVILEFALFHNIFAIALEYYENKFHIIKIYRGNFLLTIY